LGSGKVHVEARKSLVLCLNEHRVASLADSTTIHISLQLAEGGEGNDNLWFEKYPKMKLV
jgi:hypothetical protein